MKYFYCQVEYMMTITRQCNILGDRNNYDCKIVLKYRNKVQLDRNF